MRFYFLVVLFTDETDIHATRSAASNVNNSLATAA